MLSLHGELVYIWKQCWSGATEDLAGGAHQGCKQ